MTRALSCPILRGMANNVTAPMQETIKQVCGDACIYCGQTVGQAYHIGELPVTAPEHLTNHWAHVLRAKSNGGEYHPRNIAPSHARCNWLVGTDDLDTVMRQFFGDANGERTKAIRSILANRMRSMSNCYSQSRCSVYQIRTCKRYSLDSRYVSEQNSQMQSTN